MTRKNSGFTLIEMLVCVSMLGLLTALFCPRCNRRARWREGLMRQ